MTIVDIIKAGWAKVMLLPYLRPNEYKAVLHINPYNEQWPETWVLVPLPSGAMLYQQNQYGIYRFVCYDPDAPGGTHRLGLVNTTYGEVMIGGGWPPSEEKVVTCVSDLNLVQVIINNTTRYIDLDEAIDIAELISAEVEGGNVYHFTKPVKEVNYDKESNNP